MTDGAASDIALLEAWRAGDVMAGNQLVRRHFDAIFLFFSNKVSDHVDDLAQRTFLGCVEAKERIRSDGSFRAYLFGIARKQLLRYFDERGRDGRLAPVAAVAGPASDVSPSLIVAQRQEVQVLLRALRTLPLDLQIAVELLYWEDLSVHEIAEVLEIPAGTVKSRMFRARELIREAIAAMEIDDGLRDSTLHGLEKWAAELRRGR